MTVMKEIGDAMVMSDATDEELLRELGDVMVVTHAYVIDAMRKARQAEQDRIIRIINISFSSEHAKLLRLKIQ